MAPLKASMSLPVGTLFTSCLMTVITTAIVAARFWCRYDRRKKLRASDWTLLFAWLCFMGGQISMNIGLVDAGLGQWQSDMSPQQDDLLGKLYIALPILNIWGTSFAKVSGCALLLELFTGKKFRATCVIIQVILTLYSVAFLITEVAGCRPLTKFYHHNMDGTCINYAKFYTACAGVNAIANVVVVILPMPHLWGLKMPAKKKRTLTIIFSLGLVVCGIGVARAIVTVGQRFTDDFPRQLCVSSLLATLETSFCIIAVCAPLLQPAINRIHQHYRHIFHGEEIVKANSNISGFTSRTSTSIAQRTISQAPRMSVEDRYLHHISGTLDRSSVRSPMSPRAPMAARNLYNMDAVSGSTLFNDDDSQMSKETDAESERTAI